MKCMILAAGLGTRLSPITNKIPKPAVELLNVPLMYYSGELLRGLEPSLVINAHKFPESIEHMAKMMAFPYIMSLEKEKPLGSGGGLKYAQKHLEGGPFLAMNADNAVIPTSEFLIKQLWKTHHEAKDPLATLLIVEDPRVGKEFNGVWFNEKNELKEITKLPLNMNLKGMHFTGIAVYSPRIFKYLPPGESNIFANAIVPALANGEKVLGYSEKMLWLETGDEKNFLASTRTLLSQYESLPFAQKLINKYSPDSIFKKQGQYLSLVSSSAKIAPDTTFGGFFVAGKKSEVKSGSSVFDCVILPGGKCGPSQSCKNQIIL